MNRCKECNYPIIKTHTAMRILFCNNCGAEIGNYKAIDSIYAYLSCDEDGHEGILAAKIGEDRLPMVFDNIISSGRVRETIKGFAEQNNMTIKLIKFSSKECLEIFSKGKE